MTDAERHTTRQWEAEPRTLWRELKVTDAAAFLAGLIGPVGAMAFLGVGAAGILGGGGLEPKAAPKIGCQWPTACRRRLR